MYNRSYSVNYCILPARRSQKSMGATGKKIYYFLLTQYTNSCLEIFQNNLIKMREKFIILKFILIVLFILIGEIFLMQNVNSFLGSWLASFFIYPFLLAAIIPIKIYSNAEQDKSKIISDNKDKLGVYMWTNLKMVNGISEALII